MAAAKSRKTKSALAKRLLRYAPPDAHIPARLGGGILKELHEQDLVTGELSRYALAYINRAIFSGDNGRVLGYDNAHGYPHRHYMGQVTLEPNLSWEEIREKFEREWREIAIRFIEGG